MKTKAGFKLTEICGSYMLIAEGVENMDFSNLISMNESSKTLWESVEGKDFTTEDLAKTLMDNYEIDDKTPLSHEQALSDAEALINKWKKAGVIED